MVVDLFSGTGAATKAFKDRGHKVITIDIARNKWVQPDIQADIRHLPLRNLKPDFVWASPPCTEFSLARAGGKRRDIEGGMVLVAAACDAIAELRPTYWVIENVRGAVACFGPGWKRVGAWFLWGNFPPFDVGNPPLKTRDRQGKRLSGWSHGAHYRAKVPYALSLALCCAIERDWLDGGWRA